MQTKRDWKEGENTDQTEKHTKNLKNLKDGENPKIS